MNCYNGEKYLREAINSVYAQTYEKWEIIFWDNASIDRSAEIANSYDSKLNYFRGENTIPLGAARNNALEKCCGEFIAFLDCDDIWMPEKLQIQVNYMISNDFILSHSDGFKIINNRKTNTTFSLKEKNYSGYIFKKLIYNNSINLQTVIINKYKAHDNLYFLENLNIAEEYELFLRLSLIGKFGFLNDPLVYYRYHDHNTSRNTNRILSERKLILKKFGSSINANQINVNKIYSLIYRNYILNNVRQNNVKNVKQNMKYLIEYIDFKNVLIYIILRLNLGSLLDAKLIDSFRKFKKSLSIFKS